MLLRRRINGMWDKIIIDMISAFYYLTCSSNGAVAQLGERLNGIQEARGSTPLSSTRKQFETIQDNKKPSVTTAGFLLLSF